MLADRHSGRSDPLGQIGDYNFEVGDITRRVATEYEKLVRA